MNLYDILFINEDLFSNLVTKFPQIKDKLEIAKNSKVNPKYFDWLSKILLKTSEPIEDIIPLLISFEKNKEKMKTLQLQTDINQYKTIKDLNNALETLSVSRKDIKNLTNLSNRPIEQDIIYQDKEWIIAMPTTTKNSCELGKDTVWCTARTQSQNLFLSYVARKNDDIILFYIINKLKNTEEDPNAKISVGFINGEPIFPNEHGGLTVNANNDGISEQEFHNIVGSNADKFMNIMKEKANQIKNKHPAKEEMENLVKNPQLLKNKIKTFKNEDEKEQFLSQLLEYNLSEKLLIDLLPLFDFLSKIDLAKKTKYQSILNILAKDSQTDIRKTVAENENITHDILLLLANDKKDAVKQEVAQNTKTSPDILELLSNTQNEKILYFVAKNPNTPKETLKKISNTQNENTLMAIAANRGAPVDLLIMLSQHENKKIRVGIARNIKTPINILIKLSKDQEPDVRQEVASNIMTPKNILEILGRDPEMTVKIGVSSNDVIPINTQKEFLKDKNGTYLRINMAQNKNLLPEIYSELANDHEESVRKNVASNIKTPINVLIKLSTDSSETVRYNLAGNKATPLKILQQLATDTNKDVENEAKKTIAEITQLIKENTKLFELLF
jgi:hypothetical protein